MCRHKGDDGQRDADDDAADYDVVIDKYQIREQGKVGGEECACGTETALFAKEAQNADVEADYAQNDEGVLSGDGDCF
jgi:hypothetical protein